jgi:hypothetical protein
MTSQPGRTYVTTGVARCGIALQSQRLRAHRCTAGAIELDVLRAK